MVQPEQIKTDQRIKADQQEHPEVVHMVLQEPLIKAALLIKVDQVELPAVEHMEPQEPLIKAALLIKVVLAELQEVELTGPEPELQVVVQLGQDQIPAAQVRTEPEQLMVQAEAQVQEPDLLQILEWIRVELQAQELVHQEHLVAAHTDLVRVEQGQEQQMVHTELVQELADLMVQVKVEQVAVQGLQELDNPEQCVTLLQQMFIEVQAQEFVLTATPIIHKQVHHQMELAQTVAEQLRNLNRSLRTIPLQAILQTG